MIVLSNSAEQTVAVGDSVIFDTVIMHTGRAEWHRDNTAPVKLCRQCAVYAVSFNGNIAGDTAATELSLNIDASGAKLPETTMLSTPSAADQFNNVAAQTRYTSCCCGFDSLTVVNTGTTPLTLAPNSSFVINRVA